MRILVIGRASTGEAAKVAEHYDKIGHDTFYCGRDAKIDWSKAGVNPDTAISGQKMASVLAHKEVTALVDAVLAALATADVAILVAPAGAGAHALFGKAAEAALPVAVYVPTVAEIEPCYREADAIVGSLDDLDRWVRYGVRDIRKVTDRWQSTNTH